MSDKQTLILLVLIGIILALGCVYFLRSRPETGPGTRIYKRVVMAVMVLVVVVLTAPLWVLGLDAIFRGR